MHIKRIKVRPTKAPPANVCTTQLASMLACWAATSDVHSRTEDCRKATEALFECMRTTPFRGKQHRSSINYNLAKLGKTLK